MRATWPFMVVVLQKSTQRPCSQVFQSKLITPSACMILGSSPCERAAIHSSSNCSVMAKSDPTKDPKFQQVVQTFLRTPPRPHGEAMSSKPVPRKAAKRLKGKVSRKAKH